MFSVARVDGNPFAVDDYFDGAARQFFQGATINPVVDDDREHSGLRLADLRFPCRAAEIQLGRAVDEAELHLDYLPVNFEFDFHWSMSFIEDRRENAATRGRGARIED